MKDLYLIDFMEVKKSFFSDRKKRGLDFRSEKKWFEPLFFGPKKKEKMMVFRKKWFDSKNIHGRNEIGALTLHIVN